MAVEYEKGLSEAGAAVEVVRNEGRTSIEDANAALVYEKYGTQHDKVDMDRMGKLQVLRVSVVCATVNGCLTSEHRVLIMAIS